MGDAGICETQLTLHPQHGMPLLPGSSLKGCLNSWGRSRVRRLAASDPAAAARFDPSLLTWLFGNEPNDRGGVAGALIVHDAWWVPRSAAEPLVREVDTTHHAPHYSGAVRQPSDMDDPNRIRTLNWLRAEHFCSRSTLRLGSALTGPLGAWSG